MRGYLNQLRMGEVTGIGTIGRNGLLLHSRYGSRLMLGGVVTTADLPPIGQQAIKEPGCPPECRICLDVCPVGAISTEKQRVDVMRCLNFTARTPLLPKVRFLLLQSLRPRAAERLMNITTIDEHTMHVCSRCVAACPYGNGMP
jgi:epoxyqueuosine reductase QueG